MSTIKKTDFEDLVKCCEQYDAFTQYIDDYNQMEQAQENNRCLDKWFMEVVINYGIDVNGVPVELMNLGNETINKVVEWLKARELEVEEDKPTKRVWTEQEIKELVQTNDTVLYGALKKLYACQTTDEQDSKETKEHNGVGFNGVDAPFLSSVAEFLLRKGFLTDKQKFYVRKKLVKYNKQLTKLANA